MSEQLKDFLAATTLNGGIDDNDLSLVVASAANFPTDGTFDIRIDDEILTVTAVAGTTFTVTRAQGTPATTAAAHLDGVAVKLVLTKRALEQKFTDALAALLSESAFLEAVDDRVAALLVQGSNVTLTYNDAANTLTIAASGGSPTFHGCRLRNTANQDVTGGNADAITFNTELFDTDGYHDTGSNTSRITIPTGLGGKYLIGCTLWFQTATAGNTLDLYLIRNGWFNPICFERVPTDASVAPGCTLVTIYDLAQADYVEVFFNPNVNNRSAANGVAAPLFWAYLIG